MGGHRLDILEGTASCWYCIRTTEGNDQEFYQELLSSHLPPDFVSGREKLTPTINTSLF